MAENKECRKRCETVDHPLPSIIAEEHLKLEVKRMMMSLRGIRAVGDVHLLKKECIRILGKECSESKVKRGLALSELAVAYDMYGCMDSLRLTAHNLQDLVNEIRATNDTNDTLEVRNDIIQSILARRSSANDFRYKCEDAMKKVNVSPITRSEAKYHYACERQFVLEHQNLITEAQRDEEIDHIIELYEDSCTLEAEEDYVRICTGRTMGKIASLLMTKHEKDFDHIQKLVTSIKSMPRSHWGKSRYLLLKIQFAFIQRDHEKVTRYAKKAQKEAKRHKMKHIAWVAEAIGKSSETDVGQMLRYLM
eukprot:Phypoly_transcript_10065.p1 GENE.Phypoly_transcript_10065~~Phypoly_transcript_10065.p1  ORF type:complete len:307 (+),score=29.85 Phypoly_transcript_10065:381-1301(+)